MRSRRPAPSGADPALISDRSPQRVRRLRRMELGAGLLVVAVPLAFIPASAAPFLDVKLVLVAAAAVLMWTASDRRGPLGVPAAVWVGILALAGVFGVDRWWSLVGPENQGTGLVLLGSCAAILVAASDAPATLRDRIPVWLVASASIASAVSLAAHAFPGALGGIVGEEGMSGGTLGNPVFLAAFAAVGTVATFGLRRVRPWMLASILMVLASALALSTKRIGLVGMVIGLVVCVWRMRPPWRRAAGTIGLTVATIGAWTLQQSLAGSGTGAGRLADVTSGSALARISNFPVFVHAWLRRPLLGWGPGNTWGAYVSTGTRHELYVGRRGLGDAHNLYLEGAVTTGVIGLAALLVLSWFVIRHVRRGPRSAGWVTGVGAALVAVHLLQPLNVTLTPLLFLVLGLAGPLKDAGEEGVLHDHRPRPPFLRFGVAGVLAAGVALSLLVTAASVLERNGRTYGSEWSLRTSLALTPSRVSAAEALEVDLALDARGHGLAAGSEAEALAAETVRRHPWNPSVRLVAADVHALLGDRAGAKAWLRAHLARFPNDPFRDPDDPRPI